MSPLIAMTIRPCVVIYAGAPMYRSDQLYALRKLGKVLVQYFGMGEVTGNITVLPPALHSEIDAEMPVGSCGFPRTGMDVAILDASGQPLEPGITGEICVRGPGVFAGYYDNPEATAKATSHGWFHTGDLGRMDARGFVYITGRASDMYISGGSNVYPREIEEALLLHPAVAEALRRRHAAREMGRKRHRRAGVGAGDKRLARGVVVALGRQAGKIQMAARVCLLARVTKI
jgi:acyl-CoA synthetase (AMP-forming)/AMP-acid ligase II